MRVERADFDDLVTLVTQAPTWEKERLRRDPHPPARDRRGEARRAGADPRPLDVAARARDAQGAGPARVGGVPGGQAPARRARELPRPPPRGERGKARQGRARAAAAGRCRAAGFGGGLHAARDEADRRRTRRARHDPGGRARARGEPPRAEAGLRPQQAEAAAEAQGRRVRCKGRSGQARTATDEAKAEAVGRVRDRSPRPTDCSPLTALIGRPISGGRPAGALAGVAPSSSSRSRRKRVSSAARLSPDGSSSAASIRSTRRSSSST